jgi:hypothetical protein
VWRKPHTPRGYRGGVVRKFRLIALSGKSAKNWNIPFVNWKMKKLDKICDMVSH